MLSQKSDTLSQSKGFAPVLLLLIVVLVGAGLFSAYYYGKSEGKLAASISQITQINQPTPTPTANEVAGWLTYKNSIYRFEVKYPNGWYIGNCGNSETVLLNPSGTIECATDAPYPISLNIGKAQTRQETVESWKDGGFQISNEEGGSAENSKIYTVEKVEPAPRPDKLKMAIVPLTTGYSLVVTLSNLSYEEIFNQILSTFKFIE